jgi:hypothetical protein
MVLDSALADAEIRGDILAGVASENQRHDLALARSEACAFRGMLSPGEQLAQDPLLSDQLVNLTTQNAF